MIEGSGSSNPIQHEQKGNPKAGTRLSHRSPARPHLAVCQPRVAPLHDLPVRVVRPIGAATRTARRDHRGVGGWGAKGRGCWLQQRRGRRSTARGLLLARSGRVSTSYQLSVGVLKACRVVAAGGRGRGARRGATAAATAASLRAPVRNSVPRAQTAAQPGAVRASQASARVLFTAPAPMCARLARRHRTRVQRGALLSTALSFVRCAALGVSLALPWAALGADVSSVTRATHPRTHLLPSARGEGGE